MANTEKQSKTEPVAHVRPLQGLLTAIMNVQCKVGSIKKDTKNPFFKSKYADLAGIWDSISDLMIENGLCVVHTLFEDEALNKKMSTRIYHAPSCQFIESICPINPAKDDAQGYGSAITYMRRYSLSAMLGLVTDEDDDGNAASDGTPKPANAPKPPNIPKPDKPVPMISLEEFNMLKDSLETARDLAELKTSFENVQAASKRMEPIDMKALTDLKDQRKNELL